MLQFWRFKQLDLQGLVAIKGEYNLYVVVLSLFVATLAAYSALTVLERIKASQSQQSTQVWLGLGAFVLGIGVWAMHFTGMLAFTIPATMTYSPLITLISSVCAIPGAYIALTVLAKEKPGVWHIQGGALALAVGIGSMHYLGMEAMSMSAVMSYDFNFFILSIVVAHLLAVIAMYARLFTKTNENSPIFTRFSSALLIALSISAMHYTAMRSASFYVPKGLNELHEDHNLLTLVFSLAIMALMAIFAGVTVVASIIDRRMQSAQEAAANSEIREQAIIDALVDGVLVLNENGLIINYNKAASVIFGHSRNTVIGKPIDILMPCINYQELSIHTDKNGKAVRSRYAEVSGHKANGDRFPAEVSFSNISTSDKPMYNCLIRDVSERRVVEDQLRQSQKLESIGQLAAGIAHEINTPTQYILDNTSFLKKAFSKIIPVLSDVENLFNNGEQHDFDQRRDAVAQSLKRLKIDFLSEEIPKSLDQSIEGLSRVSKIVGAMKSFSHPSMGELQNTDLLETIETTITIARSEWRYYADIFIESEPELPLVPCLRDELNQVILNLIVNGVHAIQDTIKPGVKEKGKIKIQLKTAGNYVEIIVSDDGAGMPEAVMAKIFDPFFTTKEIGKGTGQGLSIAYAVIVDKHQGEISVQSTPGVGTSFTIRLPMSRGIEPAALNAGTS